jgi:hypothetical protein
LKGDRPECANPVWTGSRAEHDLLGWRRLTRTQIDLEAKNSVLESGGRVTDHCVILKIDLGGLNESLSIGTFDWREAASPHGVGPHLKASNHVVGVEGRIHAAMLRRGFENG